MVHNNGIYMPPLPMMNTSVVGVSPIVIRCWSCGCTEIDSTAFSDSSNSSQLAMNEKFTDDAEIGKVTLSGWKR